VTEDLTLKILVFSQYFWPESFLINDLAKGLVDNDHQVEVLTGKPNYPHGIKFKGYEGFGYQLESNEGILIHRIPILARGWPSPVSSQLHVIYNFRLIVFTFST